MEDETEEQYLHTQEARRITRRKLRDVLDQLQAQRLDLSDFRNSSQFKEIIRQVEEMFQHEVGLNVRELKFDALVMRELTDLLKTQALKLESMSKRCDFEVFAQRLKASMTRLHHTDRIQWQSIGDYTIPLYSVVPMYTTMLGPIEKEEKKRKVAERRAKEDIRHVVTQEAETLDNKDKDKDEATNHRVAHLVQFIAEKRSKFDVMDTLIDAEDPIQTVENFFDFSFLIKEKNVAVELDKASKSVIGVQVDAGKVSNAAEKKQMVLSISMRDLMRLQQLEKNDPERNPLHRADSVYAAKDAHEQINMMEQEANRNNKGRKHQRDEPEDEEEDEEEVRAAPKRRRGK